MGIKRLRCWITAIPFWIKTGEWIPHLYREDSSEKCIIIASDTSFRVSKNYIHNENERVYPNATLIRAKCVHCGKELLSWIDGEIPIIGDKSE